MSIQTSLFFYFSDQMNQSKNNPLVSIVMPAYNAENHIHECLNSIIRQSYTNWELSIVDDFSSDRTWEIVQSFSKKDHRIRLFKNTNKGIIPALRLAFKKSSGEYITRMDADDIMKTTKIETLLKIPTDHNTSCVTNYVEYFSDGKLQGGFIRYANWLNGLIDKKAHWKAIYQECVIPSPSWMMSRDVFESIGAFQSDRYPEDYDLCFRLYEAKIPVIGIPQVLHLWRDHPTRASRNDPNYMDQHFIDLKLHYFDKLDLDKSKTLFLWGGGPTGKKLAKKLIDKDITFRWCTGNQSKVGKHIYGIKIEEEKVLLSSDKKQIIFAIKQSDFVHKNPFFDKISSSSHQLFRFY